MGWAPVLHCSLRDDAAEWALIDHLRRAITRCCVACTAAMPGCCTPSAGSAMDGGACDPFNGSPDVGCGDHSYCMQSGSCACCPLWLPGPGGANATGVVLGNPHRDGGAHAVSTSDAEHSCGFESCPVSWPSRCYECWNAAWALLLAFFFLAASFSLGVTLARVQRHFAIRGRGRSRGAVSSSGSSGQEGRGATGHTAAAGGAPRARREILENLTFKDAALALNGVSCALHAYHAFVVLRLEHSQISVHTVESPLLRLADTLWGDCYVILVLNLVALVHSVRPNHRRYMAIKCVLALILLLLPAGSVFAQLAPGVRFHERLALDGAAFAVTAVAVGPIAIVYIRELRSIVLRVAQYGRWEAERVNSGLRYLRVALVGGAMVIVCVVGLGVYVAAGGPARWPISYGTVWACEAAMEAVVPLHVALVSTQWLRGWPRVCPHCARNSPHEEPSATAHAGPGPLNKGATAHREDSEVALSSTLDTYGRMERGNGGSSAMVSESSALLGGARGTLTDRLGGGGEGSFR